MKVWTLTETHDYEASYLLDVYATPELAKEACWQKAEAYPQPYTVTTMESTEDGDFLSIRVGTVAFEVNEYEVISA
jgi:hypothetical protein